MLLAMQKVQMIGLTSDREKAVKLLLELGIWHPEDASQIKSPALHAADLPNSEREDIAFQLARADAALQLLPRRADEQEPRDLPSLAEVKQTLDTLMPELQDYAGRLDDAKERLAAQPSRSTLLQSLWPATAKLMLSADESAMALTYDRRLAEKVKLLLLDIELKIGTMRLASVTTQEGTLATCITFPETSRAFLRSRLQLDYLSVVDLPREIVGATLPDLKRQMELEHKDLEQKLQDISNQLDDVSKRFRAQVLACRMKAQRRLEELDAIRLMGATRHAFVLEGWVPRRELPKLEKSLQQEFGEGIVLHECDPGSHDSQEVPVAFDNPAYLKPYQNMIQLMGLPASGSRDPSFLMAVFLPLFFGIIVGDIGYGFLFLLLGLWARHHFKRNENIRSVTGVLVFGSLWAIFWGFLYGEIFGTLQYQLGLADLYIFLPRTGERIGELMIFAVVLGAAHVALGLALGLWDAFREKHLKEALAKGGLLLTLCGLFLVTAIVAGLLPESLYTPTYVGILVGVVILISGAGILGVIELFETMGNVLSYLRLTAVGLAGVYIALVANKMVGVLGNVVLGIVVALLLHALNFAILLMSPSIQALRLHYVEFFRQFYRSGGQEYQPLRYGS